MPNDPPMTVLRLADLCFAQIHGGLWAWPCWHPKDHQGLHSWENDLDQACVCHRWIDVTAFGDATHKYQSVDGDHLADGAAL